MATTINTGVSAYLNTMKQMTGGAEPQAGIPGGASFADILKSGIGSAIDAQHKGEQVSASAIAGKASMTDVLQAVNNAELALNSVLAIRDKVVQAYEAIMRTQI
jgi:flagellar hook-basal body complex protein FliE